MSAPQSDEFKKAIVESKQLTKKPGDLQLLRLYALYKIGTGEDFYAPGNTEPSFLEFKAKAKYNVWKEEAAKGTTVEEAQKLYVELIEQLKAELGFDPTKVPETIGK